MSDINTVVISGHLISEPRLIQPGNNPNLRCQFTITMNDGDGSHMYLLETRGKFAEVCHKYLKPGREIIASGKISWDYWDGFLIVAKQVQFLGMKPKNETPPAELAPKPLLAWGEAAAPVEEAPKAAEEPVELFTRKEETAFELPPVGRYRIRSIRRGNERSLDIREYISSPEREWTFTTKGIRLTHVDDAILLRDNISDAIARWFTM